VDNILLDYPVIALYFAVMVGAGYFDVKYVSLGGVTRQ
jgi:hypothetical protein